jgi:hypothetical protein
LSRWQPDVAGLEHDPEKLQADSKLKCNADF